MPLPSFTVVKYYGKQNNSRCGYCKNVKSSHSHGMHAYIMTAQDYQDLIDRGWRRSGLYCYKPNNKITCCPCYTIKCDSQEFKLSKSHKKILRRMAKFLTDGKKEDEDKDFNEDFNINGDGNNETIVESIQEEPERPSIIPSEINLDNIKSATDKKENNTIVATTSIGAVDDDHNKSMLDSSSSLLLVEKDIKKDSIDPLESKPPRKKAKKLRLERKKLKLEQKGASMDEFMKSSSMKKSIKNKEKSLHDYIHDIPENSCHKLKVILIPSNKGVTTEVIDLYRKYQVIVHNDPPQKITKKSFERFLVRTPLQNKKTPDGPSEGYGSFHQQYWLDNKLIAVGVIDILPYCVSSVYFFYDPDYSFLSLGTYGSLREIDFTRQLSEQVSSLKYYYMGFYIHSCPKMRYKGKLVASYLLCPEVYTWHLLTDEMKAKLDVNKYQRFNDDVNAKDENEFSVEDDLDFVLILFNQRTYIPYGEYKRSFNVDSVDQMLEFVRRRIYSEMIGEHNEEANIIEYGKLVGKTCARRMLYMQ